MVILTVILKNVKRFRGKGLANRIVEFLGFTAIFFQLSINFYWKLRLYKKTDG